MISESIGTALSLKNVKMSQSSKFAVVGVCARATGTEGPRQPPNGILETHRVGTFILNLSEEARGAELRRGDGVVVLKS